MDRTKQRELASRGGTAAHLKGTAHTWTADEAREAGRKGGIITHQNRKARQLAECYERTAQLGPSMPVIWADKDVE